MRMVSFALGIGNKIVSILRFNRPKNHNDQLFYNQGC